MSRIPNIITMLRLALGATAVMACSSWVAVAMMSTPGQFTVSETGAAVYSVPIQVPPGTAGMVPALSLVYNSQAGNGLLGTRWSLSGLSAITRCPRTVAQDGVGGGINFDTNDRFCLDAQRLILIAGASYGADGAEYRTERESFSKIISYGTAGTGPAWFKAWTKSGQILEYANTADSRIEAQGNTSVRVWALNRIQDTKGNYLTVTYTEDNPNGDFHPTRIDYTGNAGAGLVAGQSVRFTYQSRTDISPLYLAGSVIKTMNRLTNVKTYIGETLVKDYRLVYDNLGTVGQSRPTSVQECAGDGSCLPSISLTWLTETASTRNFNGAGSGNWTGHANGATQNLLGDFNVDGKQDILGYSTNNGWAQSPFNVCSSSGTGYSCSPWNVQELTSPSVADFNGDGKPDVAGFVGELVYFDFGPPPTGTVDYHIKICLNTGSSFSCSVWANTVMQVGLGSPPVEVQLTVDFNGDGRSDWAFWGPPANPAWKVCASTGSSLNCSNWPGPTAGMGNNVHGDFNGDGKADLAGYVSGTSWKVCLSTGSGFSCSTWSGHGGGTANNISGDFNGDARKDLAQYVSGNAWNVCLSTGTGFSCANWSGVNATSANTKVGDFNGDGRADISAQTSAGVWNTCLSTGTGFNCSDWSGTTATVANTVVGDFDGDGKEDLSGNTSGSTWNTTLSGTPFPDRIQTVDSGLGGQATLTYLPLTNATVYTKDTTATYPTLDFQGPAYVVSSYTTSNGIGGNVQTTYSYTGAKLDFNGRGFLGFRITQSTDPQGLKSLTTLRQDWPYIGLPAQVKRTKADGSVLRQVDNTYACKDLDADPDTCTVGAGKRYFAFVSQADEVGYDLNGAFITKVRTANQFDAFGNATQVTLTHLNSDGSATGYSKTTTSTFTNDTANWFLGRLTRSTVLSAAP